MIDIVTPRGGKTHVRLSHSPWSPGPRSTLCGRQVAGFDGTTEAFVGDDICKLCAKALPASLAETEAVLIDLAVALEQSANGEVEDRGDFTQYATDELTQMAQEMGTFDQPNPDVRLAYGIAVGWAGLISDGRKRHGMVQHARSKRRAAMKKLLASL